MSRSGKTQQEDEVLKLTIVRSSGGKAEFSIPPSETLQDLKNLISQSPPLGRLRPQDQRIFHLGRELKTNGRTLEKLGVTRFGVSVIHVHSSKPQVAQEDEDEDDDVVEVVAVKQHDQQVIDLSSDEDEQEGELALEPPRRRRRRIYDMA